MQIPLFVLNFIWMIQKLIKSRKKSIFISHLLRSNFEEGRCERSVFTFGSVGKASARAYNSYISFIRP